MTDTSADTDALTAPDPAGPSPSSSLALERQVAFGAVGRRLFSRRTEPTMLGHFMLLNVLGRGGMGVVYKAYDEILDRSIAIKLLRANTSEQHAERLRREAQALAKLSHPNVVQVYEVGEADGQQFIAMELVVGETLRRWHGAEHDWRARVRMYLDVGAGLAAAHAVGLVHRDFKPDNCIIDEQGRPKVLDFGLVREAGQASASSPSLDTLDSHQSGSSLTATGTVMGTLGYIPPEQCDGQPADARSDQFAYCVALFEALYGERPFPGDTIAQQTAAVIAGRVRPAPKGTAVPDDVRRIVLRGLSSDPAQRWPSMDALLTALRARVFRQRRHWFGAGLAAGLAALGLGLVSYAQVGFRCDGAEAGLEGAWDEARRGELRSAVLDAPSSYSAETWERVERGLDDYAARWVAEHRDACEATRVREEQSEAVMDLRMECLRRRRVALQESVDVLVDADVEGIERAVELMADLPSPERCHDVAALRAAIPPPEEAAVAQEVRLQRDRLQRAVSLRRTGQFEAALGVVEVVMARAEALDYGPLVAEASFWRGRIHDDRGAYSEAESDLRRSYVLAAELGYREQEAESAAWLVQVVGIRHARHESGQVWGTTALALARGPHADPRGEGDALMNMGRLLLEQGKPQDALEHFEHAHEVFERVLGPDHPTTAYAMQNIAVVLRQLDEPERALVQHREALHTLERALGPRHPKVAAALNGMGLAYKQQGDLDEALTYMERGLALQEAALGPEHPDLAAYLNNIANLLHARGEHDQALSQFRRALAIREKAMGPEHPEVATLLFNIGNLLTGQQEMEAALEHFERALAIREAALDPGHPDVLTTLNNIAVLQALLNDHERAAESFQRLLAKHESAEEPDARAIALVHNNLAGVLESLGRREEARIHCKRALEMREAIFGRDHLELVLPLVGMADLDLQEDRVEDARALAERALSIAESENASPRVLSQTRFTLAQALWHQPDQRARARALIELVQEARTQTALYEEFETEVDTWLRAHPL